MHSLNIFLLLVTLTSFGINLNAQTTTTLLPESLQYKYDDNLEGILQYLRFNNQQNGEESFLRLKNYFTDGDILIETNRRLDMQSNADLFLRSNEIYMNTDLGTGGAGFTRLFINQAGQVGIGTTNIPTGYCLAVDGQVIAERVRVRLSQNWPDYVFAKDYELIPLGELKTHIEKNGHLPNLPNAEEVAANGHDLGEIQIKLVEKLEELTLYILQQQEQMEQQQIQINELKEQLKK